MKYPAKFLTGALQLFPYNSVQSTITFKWVKFRIKPPTLPLHNNAFQSSPNHQGIYIQCNVTSNISVAYIKNPLSVDNDLGPSSRKQRRRDGN